MAAVRIGRAVTPAEQQARHVVLMTALVYLREALAMEQYEECREIIALAQGFGATELQIQQALQVGQQV